MMKTCGHYLSVTCTKLEGYNVITVEPKPFHGGFWTKAIPK
ncbi:hypothetical protein ACFQY3_06775 [Paenibacillus farraposensis]|nr:hypothetical protein [Paenibacillus farraposensis]